MVRVERKITNPWHNPKTHISEEGKSFDKFVSSHGTTHKATPTQPATHRTLESFDNFVSDAGKEGFRMMMSGKERAATR